jgi:hypothetical protein
MTARKLSISNLILPSAGAPGRTAPEWRKDAIDAAVVAGLLLTLALVVL